MLRRATMTAMLAVALGLGILAAAGAAVPWQEWKKARAVRRLADADRAEQLFRMRYRMCAEGGWRPAQPLSVCEACISAAADQRLTLPEARVHCGAACGVD